MNLEKLRTNFREQTPDVLKKKGLLEHKEALVVRADVLVEEFRAFYHSVHPEKDDNYHPSHRTNVVEVNLSGQELSPLGKGRLVARLRGFGRPDMMDDFNESMRKSEKPEPWTHYKSANGFVVTFHFSGEEEDKLIGTELYGPGKFKRGEWIYWKDYLKAEQCLAVGNYIFEGELPLPLLGIRVAGASRALERMEKKSKETLSLLKQAAEDPSLNSELIARAQEIQETQAVA